MKTRYLIYLLNLLAMTAYGQNSYYSTKDSTQTGIRVLEGRDIEYARYCFVVKGDTLTTYTPDQITEYGFKDGRVFFSIPITLGDSTSRFFFEKLSFGKTTTYFLSLKNGIKRFYVASGNDSTLVQIPPEKEAYRKFLDSLVMDCQAARNNTSTFIISRKSMINFFRNYDHCDKSVFPKTRYGIKVGISGTRLSVVQKMSILDSRSYGFEKEFLIGAFMDAPIYSGNWSFHPEIGLKHFSTSIPKIEFADMGERSRYYELVINNASLNVPLLFRYTQYHKNMSPYIQLGPTYSRILWSKNSLITYDRNDQQLFLTVNDKSLIKNNMAGGQVGCGIIFNTAAKRSCFVEINGSRLFNLGNKYNIFNINDINVQVGFTF